MNGQSCSRRDCALKAPSLPQHSYTAGSNAPRLPHPPLPCTALSRQASPGRLGAFEEALFRVGGDGAAAAAGADAPLLAALWVGVSDGQRLVGVAFLDAASRCVALRHVCVCVRVHTRMLSCPCMLATAVAVNLQRHVIRQTDRESMSMRVLTETDTDKQTHLQRIQLEVLLRAK